MAEGTKQEKKPITLKSIKFLVGSFVYLKTDPFQYKRMVIAIHLTTAGYQYEVRLSDGDPTLHYDIELSEDKDNTTFMESLDEDD